MSARTLQEKQVKQLKKHRRHVLTKLVKDAYLLHRKGLHPEMNNLICEEFTKLGGVYVKFLQGVLLRSSLMRDWQSSDRLKIFENLESEPLDIQSILQQEFPTAQLQKITSISPTPFAAGSFGQVYFGNLQDGTQIIIKLLRPMIRETLAYDLKLIGFFTRAFVNKLSRNIDMNVVTAIDEFKRATMRETDYIEEARFGNELWQAYKDNPQFIIPRTYLELSTENIIVQEYVGGISGAQLLRLKEQGIDPAEYVKQQLGSDLSTQMELLGFEYIRGIFLLPRVQGDPHPGNVKLLDNNRVALIDFGISARSPREKAAFYGVLREYQRMLSGKIDIPMMLGQFLRFFVSDLYKAMKKVTSLLPANDKTNDLTRQMGLIAEANFQKEMGEEELEGSIQSGNILGTINQVVNSGNRFGIIVKLDDTEMLRAAQSYITLVDSFGLKGSVLPRAFKEGLEYVAKERPDYTKEGEVTMSANRAMEVISKWLERVANRDPALFKTFVNKIKAAEATAKPPKQATEKSVKKSEPKKEPSKKSDVEEKSNQ
ncbi:MAG: AarF/ABC1/UbiB kinase family protein [Candidatus Saccharimonadales bacterium]